MYAVTIQPLNAVFFVGVPPGDVPGDIQDNVEIDIPSYIYLLPGGEERPEQVLCVRKTDPKHYKLYKFQRDVDSGKYTPIGKNFGGIYSGETWERFRELLPRYLEFAAIPDDDADEAADEALRALGTAG
jgi:hypothetical protein